MSNPFDELSEKLDRVLTLVQAIEKKSPTANKRISLQQFCQREGISRVTAYAWQSRGLVELEKIGGRLFVKEESIGISKKYQRQPVQS